MCRALFICIIVIIQNEDILQVFALQNINLSVAYVSAANLYWREWVAISLLPYSSSPWRNAHVSHGPSKLHKSVPKRLEDRVSCSDTSEFSIAYCIVMSDHHLGVWCSTQEVTQGLVRSWQWMILLSFTVVHLCVCTYVVFPPADEVCEPTGG